MKANESSIDRTIRAILGVLLIILAFTMLKVTDGEILGIIAAAVGAVFLLTALVGFCPAYKLIGFSTCKCCCGSSCNTETSTDSANSNAA